MQIKYFNVTQTGSDKTIPLVNRIHVEGSDVFVSMDLEMTGVVQ